MPRRWTVPTVAFAVAISLSGCGPFGESDGSAEPLAVAPPSIAPTAASAAPAPLTPEDALRAAAQAETDAVIRLDTAAATEFLDPACTEDQRSLWVNAVSQLEPALEGADVTVDQVTVNGDVGTVTYALGGTVSVQLRSAFSPAGGDQWKLVDEKWVDAQHNCTGADDSVQAEEPVDTASAPASTGALELTPRQEQEADAPWKLESVDVTDDAGRFGGTLTISYAGQDGGQESTFQLELYRRDVLVGTLVASADAKTPGVSVTLPLTSPDSYTGGDLNYEFVVDA